MFLLVLFISAVAVWPAHADEFKPVVIYQGSIELNSFNVAIHKGVQRFEKKTNFECSEVVVGLNMDDYAKSVKKYADLGYSPIFMLYGNHFPDLVKFTRRYPATRFIVLDTVRDEPNIFSFVLAEHEGSFLAGALAAMVSKTKKIGFVSVIDTSFQRRFLCGYIQGANYIDPEIEVLEGFSGGGLGAWFNGTATAAIANSMMDDGVDIIFQAAGGAGPAVLKAVAERGMLGIGVDINQNGLYPGSVLTSMVKHTDKAIFAALMLAQRGIWRDNYKRLGLAQDAVGIVFDEHNKALITPRMRRHIEKLRNDIVFGKIKVHDYTVDRKCP